MPTYCPGVDVVNKTLTIDIPGTFVDGYLDGTSFAHGEYEGYPELLGKSYDGRQNVWRGRGRAVRLTFPLDDPGTRECLAELERFVGYCENTLGGGRGVAHPDERSLANAAKETRRRCAHALTLLPAVASQG